MAGMKKQNDNAELTEVEHLKNKIKEGKVYNVVIFGKCEQTGKNLTKLQAKIKVEANDEGGHRSKNWRKTYQLKMCIKHQKNAFKDLPALLRDGSRSGISFMAMSDTL